MATYTATYHTPNNDEYIIQLYVELDEKRPANELYYCCTLTGNTEGKAGATPYEAMDLYLASQGMKLIGYELNEEPAQPTVEQLQRELEDAKLLAAQRAQLVNALEQQRDNYKTLAESTARQLEQEQQRSVAHMRETEPAEQLLQALTKALRPIIDAAVFDQLRDTVREEVEEQLQDALQEHEVDYSELADSIDYSLLADAIDYEDTVTDTVREHLDGLQLRNVNITLEV